MNLNVSKNTYPCQSCQLRVAFNSLSLRSLIEQQIRLAAHDFFLNSALALGQKFTVSLSKLNHHLGIVYRCAIAFQLVRGQQLPSVALAEQILTNLSKLSSDNTTALDFTVKLTGTGWLDFHLYDTSLAFWLQKLPGYYEQDSVQYQEQHLPLLTATNNKLFLIEYAHARCCSLLRLAHQDKLIQLHNLDFNQPFWHWQQPEPIPYLVRDTFQLVQGSEQDLIYLLLRIIDTKAESSSADWLKLAHQLSAAMLEFYRFCRIWGEVKQQNLALAQARLGLIALTQVVLQRLLQNELGIIAFVEL